MSKRLVPYTVAPPNGHLSGAARTLDEHEGDQSAVARSIARRARLDWCGGPRYNGCTATSHHYVGTLGRHVKSGDYSPVAEVTFYVRRVQQ